VGPQREPWSFWFREDPGGARTRTRSCAPSSTSSARERARARRRRARGARGHAVDADAAAGRPRAPRDGATLRLTPRCVVDASGQAAVLGAPRRSAASIDFFKNLAIFGYFRDAERLPGELANHILSAALRRRLVLVHPAATTAP
jgi:hypothetical protein